MLPEMLGRDAVASDLLFDTPHAHDWANASLALEFEVRASAPVAVGLDGEALVLTPPLRFVSLPGALRVRVPRRASGLSPAGARSR
jgi:diacylglycerol kinase family enzyme